MRFIRCVPEKLNTGHTQAMTKVMATSTQEMTYHATKTRLFFSSLNRNVTPRYMREAMRLRLICASIGTRWRLYLRMCQRMLPYSTARHSLDTARMTAKHEWSVSTCILGLRGESEPTHGSHSLHVLVIRVKVGRNYSKAYHDAQMNASSRTFCSSLGGLSGYISVTFTVETYRRCCR